MITSQRVIIYRTDTNHDEFDYEITHVYDFSSIANVVVIGLYFIYFSFNFLKFIVFLFFVFYRG